MPRAGGVPCVFCGVEPKGIVGEFSNHNLPVQAVVGTQRCRMTPQMFEMVDVEILPIPPKKIMLDFNLNTLETQKCSNHSKHVSIVASKAYPRSSTECLATFTTYHGNGPNVVVC